jgi:hypothetical protein
VPVADKPLGKICTLVLGDDARPKLVVLRDPVGFVVPAKLVADDVCSKHHRRVHEGIQKGRRPCDGFLGKRRVEQPREPVVFVNDPAVAAQEHDFGPDGGQLTLLCEPQGVCEIVSVLPRDPLSARQLKPLVQACCLAFVVRVADEADAWVLAGPGFGDFR